MNHATIIAFCGPSGAGKSTMIDKLLDAYPDYVKKWKQTTTRPSRGVGDDYIFLSLGQYSALRGTLTVRTEFNGNYYGTIPEVFVDNTVVVTIADVKGLEDLRRDVEDHNRHIEFGSDGKFGSKPVVLHYVYTTYDLTEEAVAERGRSSRGLEFVKAEADGLRDWLNNHGLNFSVLNTAGGTWTEEEDFFNDVVWPLIHAAPQSADPANLYASVLSRIEEIRDFATSKSEDFAMLKKLDELLAAFVLPEEPTASTEVTDDVDAALLGTLPDVVSEAVITSNPLDDATADDGSALEVPTDFINDLNVVTTETTDERGNPVVIDDAAIVPVQETVLEDTVVETVDPDAGDGSGLIADLAATTVVEEATQDAEAATQTEEATPATEAVVEVETALICPVSILEAYDFPDWLVEDDIGLDAFDNTNTFRMALSRFLISGGSRLPETSSVGIQSTTDSRGGVIREFTVSVPNGKTYFVEYNERLRRPINYGLR